MHNNPNTTPRIQTTITHFSNRLAQAEQTAAGYMCLAVLLLILCNVASRALRLPIFWIDEVAIYAMIWMALLAASSAVNTKGHIAVSLVTDMLPEIYAKQLRRLTDFTMVALGAALTALAWVWYDPITLALLGGDTVQFSQKTFNFIYTEPTIATGLPKYIFWLIMPLFSVNMTIHSLSLIIGSHDKDNREAS